MEERGGGQEERKKTEVGRRRRRREQKQGQCRSGDGDLARLLHDVSSCESLWLRRWAIAFTADSRRSLWVWSESGVLRRRIIVMAKWVKIDEGVESEWDRGSYSDVTMKRRDSPSYHENKLVRVFRSACRHSDLVWHSSSLKLVSITPSFSTSCACNHTHMSRTSPPPLTPPAKMMFGMGIVQ